MPSKQFNENIKDLAKSGFRETILEILDEVKNYVADARNGEWSTDTRKASIEALDKVLYNKIKNYSETKQSEGDTWL